MAARLRLGGHSLAPMPSRIEATKPSIIAIALTIDSHFGMLNGGLIGEIG